MTMKRTIFYRYVTLKKPLNVIISDGEVLTTEDVRSIYLKLTKEHGSQLLELNNTLYVLKIRHNLLSIYRATKAGDTISFSNNRCQILKNNIRVTALNRNDV